MRRVFRYTFVALALLTSACTYGGGEKVEQKALSDLKVGTTTFEQVVSALGPPTNTITNSDGTRIVTYAHYATHIDPVMMIPMVSYVAGGSKTESQAVTLNFDKRGVLSSYSSTGGEACTKGGLFGPGSGQLKPTNC